MTVTYVSMYGIYASGVLMCAFRVKQEAINYIDMLVNLGFERSDYFIKELEVQF